ncbi:hypothetical protein BSU04_19030 [Caballeronia sordidicola]|uniref:Uncharacterized protein n=1 Tax=Caballeronia sordidicola TaxID=196367 RepID=A0A226X1W5_CABSO|nr:hypothetical protein BSU04_19030 [Caballeronia sordidicola]
MPTSVTITRSVGWFIVSQLMMTKLRSSVTGRVRGEKTHLAMQSILPRDGG